MTVTFTSRSSGRRGRGVLALAFTALVAATLVAVPAHSQAPVSAVVTSPPNAQELDEAAYLPSEVILPPGATLQYLNTDTVQHNIFSTEPGLFSSDFLGTGEIGEVEGVSDLPPGAYSFLCTLHPQMKGTLTILGAGGDGGDGEGDDGADDAPEEPVDEDVVYETLVEGTNEPMAIEVASDGRVLWTERDGTFNVLPPGAVLPASTQLAVAGNLCEPCVIADPQYTVGQLSDPAAIGETPLGLGGPQEAGLYGLLLDDDFQENNLLYLYYAVPGSGEEVTPGVVWGHYRLSSFVLDPETNLLDLSSEQELLTVDTEWNHPAHHGGDLEYLPDGTIVLTTGDNVIPSASDGYGPRDHRAPWTNAELTSANPADRRGKILRLREDGSVPDGSLPGEMPNPFIGMEGHNPYIEDSPDNLFVGEYAGTPGDGWIEFDPYVYSLGWKQAWRAMVMPTGDLYVSDVGPDAGVDDPERGPRGFEEINRVPFGGGTHHGWPRCIGPNWPYVDVDWETLETHGPLDCTDTAPIARPIGGSEPTVRGMAGAVMYYPSGACDGSQNDTTTYDCDQWPIVGSGGKTSEPSLFYPGDATGPLALPERYRDRLFVFEWSRNFVLTIPADATTGDLELDSERMDLVNPAEYSVNPNTEELTTSVNVMLGGLMSPIDATLGPDGAVYFLEYGPTYYVGEVGRVSRLRAAQPQDADAGGDGGTGEEPGSAPSGDGNGSPGSGNASAPSGEGDRPPLPATGFPVPPLPIMAVVILFGLVGPLRRRRLIP